LLLRLRNYRRFPPPAGTLAGAYKAKRMPRKRRSLTPIQSPMPYAQSWPRVIAGWGPPRSYSVLRPILLMMAWRAGALPRGQKIREHLPVSYGARRHFFEHWALKLLSPGREEQARG
jgi:hypothetical protein